MLRPSNVRCFMALFLLGPHLIEQTELELNAVEAANLAGVRPIVKQSVMGAENPSFSLAKVHRPVEHPGGR